MAAYSEHSAVHGPIWRVVAIQRNVGRNWQNDGMEIVAFLDSKSQRLAVYLFTMACLCFVFGTVFSPATLEQPIGTRALVILLVIAAGAVIMVLHENTKK
jgi:hypothetical protein